MHQSSQRSIRKIIIVIRMHVLPSIHYWPEMANAIGIWHTNYHFLFIFLLIIHSLLLKNSRHLQDVQVSLQQQPPGSYFTINEKTDDLKYNSMITY